MKTSAVTAADLARSVLAVPPLARNGDLTLNPAANAALIRHLEAGGVSTLMYGGNANFYNIGLYEYGAVLDFLEQTAAAESWVIPSVGPDFGKLLDQARVLRTRAFPTAMVLPQTFPATPDGCEKAIRMFADSYGRKVIVYIKAENYLTPAHVGRLVDAGVVAAIKYAVVRDDPADDPLLRAILERVDPKLVVSGIGERPAVAHLRDFGLAAFTSGSVCVAPRGSMRMLDALQAERLRDRGADSRRVPAARGSARRALADSRAARSGNALRHRRHGADAAATFQHRRRAHRRHSRGGAGAARTRQGTAMTTRRKTPEELRSHRWYGVERHAAVRPSFAHRRRWATRAPTTSASRSSRSSTPGATSTPVTRISASAPRRSSAACCRRAGSRWRCRRSRWPKCSRSRRRCSIATCWRWRPRSCCARIRSTARCSWAAATRRRRRCSWARSA